MANDLINLALVMNEASLKTPKQQGSDSLQIVKHIDVLGGGHAQRAQKLHTLSPPHTLPTGSLPFAYYELHPLFKKTVNISTFMGSGELF